MKGILLLGLALAAAIASEVTPVQKVVSMMKKMVDKGKSEMEEEQQQFAEYVAFCENTTVEKARRIEEAAELIEMLTASVEEATGDAERLSKEITQQLAIIETTSAEKDKAVAVREEEASDYKVALRDYSDSILAIGRAMEVLKKQDVTRPQAESLLQLSNLHQKSKIRPDEASKFLDSFLKGQGQDASSSRLAERPPLDSLLERDVQPLAAGYEFQSEGVIGLLEKLEAQFKDESNTLKMEELKKKNAHNTLLAGLDAENADADKDTKRFQQQKASILEQKAKDEEEIAVATASLEQDKKYKKDLEMSWAAKTKEYDNRQKLRAEELSALAKAIEIISGEAVTSNAQKYLPNLLQKASTALAVVKSEQSMLRVPALKKVVQFLQQKGESLHSQELTDLARSASASPMDKVVTMIEDLITRLKEQAATEATKQAYCSEEISKNEATRSERTDDVEGLQAEVAQFQASIKKLTEDIASLNQETAQMNTAMSAATTLRQKEKKENAAAIADAKSAQDAVAQALSVLTEFYDKASSATVFVQQTDAQPAPEAFATKSFSVGSESGGVIGMIEVIQSDFARLEAETTAAEEASEKEYESFMEDSKLDVVAKEKDARYKQSRADMETEKMNYKKLDLAQSQKELDTALATHEELKSQCADAQASYEERKQQRDEEIKDLRTALEALNTAQIR